MRMDIKVLLVEKNNLSELTPQNQESQNKSFPKKNRFTSTF